MVVSFFALVAVDKGLGKLGDLIDKFALEGLKTISGKPSSKEKLAGWIIERSKYLNDNHWVNIINAEQERHVSDNSQSKRASERLQDIAERAQNDIKKYKAELENLELPEDLDPVKRKCGAYLDDWQNFFHYMAKYDTSGDLNDLGTATRSYNSVDIGLSELIEMLGFKSIKRSEPSTYPQDPQPQAQQPQTMTRGFCPNCRSPVKPEDRFCGNCGARLQ